MAGPGGSWPPEAGRPGGPSSSARARAELLLDGAPSTGPSGADDDDAQPVGGRPPLASAAAFAGAGPPPFGHHVPVASGHYAAVTLTYPEYSLLLLHKTNPLRKACVYTISTTWFDRFILLMILGNCITLALSSNRQGFAATQLGYVLDKFEYLWISVFTAEMVLKVLAMGFVLRPGTYLRDGWNVLDFTVVVLGIVDMFSSGNMTALRTIRVLRPLRTITRIRGMRVLVATMIKSLPMLLDVILLCAFTFFIFGIVAVQLFSGQLRFRCAEPSFDGAYPAPEGNGQLLGVAYTVPDEQAGDLCSGPMASDVKWYNVSGMPMAVAGSGGHGRLCPSGLYCTGYGNPVYGFVSFDNMLWAWLTIFQCITQEAWTDDMYYTQDAINYWVWIFYLVIIIFGSFFLINLALAVLYVQFSNQETEDPSVAQPNPALAPGSASASADAAGGARGGAAAAAEQQQQQQDKQGQDKQGQAGKDAGGDSDDDDDCDDDEVAGGQQDGKGGSLQQQDSKPVDAAELQAVQAQVAAMSRWRRAVHRVSESKALEYTTVALIVLNTAVMCINWYRMPASVEAATNYINYALTVYFLLELIIKLLAMGPFRYFRDGMNVFDAIVVATSVTELLLDVIPGVGGVGPLSVLRTLRLLRVFRLARQWKELNLIIQAMFKSVKSTIYLSLLMLLFMFIAALMGMQFFGYRFEFCDYVDGASPHCPLGEDVWGGCPNHFDCYVPCQPSELDTWVPAPGSHFNGLGYCQRFCTANATDGGGSGSAPPPQQCEAVAMVGKADVPRGVFDSILWAMLTIFQLLTGENWNNIMYDAMRTTTPWAAVYFIVVIIIGLYLVFNLFIALLLENFSTTFGAARDDDKAQKELMSRRKKAGSDSSDEDDDAADDYATRSEGSNRSTHSNGTSLGDWLGSGRTEAFNDAHNGDADSLHDDDGDDGHLGSGHMHPLQHVLSGRNAAALQLKHLRQVAPDGAPPTPGPCSPDGAAAEGIAGPAQPQQRQRQQQQQQQQEQAASGPSGSGRRGVKFAGGVPLPGGAVSGRRSVEFAELGSELNNKDVAMLRASFIRAHHSAGDGGASSKGGGGPDSSPGGGPGGSFVRSLTCLVTSIKSIKRSEHLRRYVRGQSLFCLGPDSWLRWRCARIVHSTHFENAMLVIILASSICLALDRPGLDPESQLARALHVMDFIFTGAFAVEAGLKIVAWGFLFSGKTAYLRNGWNVLDLVIVIVGFVLIILEETGAGGDNLGALRVLRTLRALRPLRAASRWEGMRIVVNALFAVIPALFNVALVCMLFYLIFAILAVNLLKGKLHNCVDAASGEVIDPFYVLPPGATLTEQWCQQSSHAINTSAYHARLNVSVPSYTLQAEWVNPVANFDNVAVAMLTLFQVATLELWVDIMYSAVDAVAPEKQPLWNHNPAMAIYFVVFIAIGSFFVLNLFIGVTLDKFSELQQAASGSSVFITPQQQSWVDVQKLLLRIKMQLHPQAPNGPPWRERLYELAMGRAFDVVIMATIGINVLVMAMVHADMGPGWQHLQAYSNAIFTAVFLAEAVIKLLAFGPAAYFRDKWNAFDFFVVVVSIVSVVLDFSDTQSLSFMPILRVLRVLRIFRLIKRAKGLQRLLTTLIYSLPALANVGSVMALLFFIWGVVGMNLFGGIKKGKFITRHANFDTFSSSLLVLLRMLTGESWDGIMQDCMVTKGCVLLLADTTSPGTGQPLAAGSYYDPGDPLLHGVPSDLQDNQCTLSPALAVAYFMSFVIICAFILLNLVIAIILENMMTSEVDEGLPVSRSWLGQFVEAWSAADPAASGFMHTGDLPALVMAVDPPMGTRGEPNARSVTQALIMAVDIPNHPGNTVSFIETLHAMAGRVCGTELPDIEEDYLTARFARRQPNGGQECPKYTAAHFHAALHVQAAVRGFMARHNMRDLMHEFGNVPGAAGVAGAGAGAGLEAGAAGSMVAGGVPSGAEGTKGEKES